mgnify:CR=1 FL=1
MTEKQAYLLTSACICSVFLLFCAHWQAEESGVTEAMSMHQIFHVVLTIILLVAALLLPIAVFFKEDEK